MKDYNIKALINTLSSQIGLYGFFANSGFGATTLLMQIARCIVDLNGGAALVFSLELSKEEWCKRMQSIGLSLDHFVVRDDILPTDQTIEDAIKTTEDTRFVLIDYLELLDQNTSHKLNAIAKKYSIPIFVCGRLGRNSGFFDPNNRPDLISVSSLFGPKQVLPLSHFDFLALLHRDHDCDWGNNRYRYNISNRTELIIKIHNIYPRRKLGSVFFEWNEQRKCFDI